MEITPVLLHYLKENPKIMGGKEEEREEERKAGREEEKEEASCNESLGK